MKILFIVMAMLLTFAADAFSLNGKVVDKTTRQPIAYVNIGILGKNNGTVTNEKGEFIIELPDNSNDSLRFSCIGFLPVQMPLQWFQNQVELNKTFAMEMESRVYELKEAVVRKSMDKEVTIGGTSEGSIFVNTFNPLSKTARENLGSEYGLKIHLKSYPAMIQKLRIKFSANSYDTLKFRFNIYKLNGKSVGENVLDSSIILNVIGKARGWITFDLAKYNLYINKDCIFSLEWIGYYPDKQKGMIFVPVKFPSFGSTYYRESSQNKWETFSGYMSMNLTINY